MRSWGTVALATVLLGCSVSAVAGQEQRDLYRIDAVRVDEAPRLDGIVDESIWQVAEVMDAFVQQEPDEGAPGSERTEVRILYDAENVYFGIRAFDASPAAVTATEMRRDSERILEEDNIQIILDTFMDSRSGYMFVTNPLGAKLDQQIFNEGEGGRPGQVSSNITGIGTASGTSWRAGPRTVGAPRSPSRWSPSGSPIATSSAGAST